jgi:uncharacterized protein
MVATFPWWAWPLLLFATAFLLGIVAVIGGIGGGVLFVPIVGGMFSLGAGASGLIFSTH